VIAVGEQGKPKIEPERAAKLAKRTEYLCAAKNRDLAYNLQDEHLLFDLMDRLRESYGGW